MIINCPKCQTGFVVPDAAITAEGRKVKCSKCDNVWLAQKTAEAIAEEAGDDSAIDAATDNAAAANPPAAKLDAEDSSPVAEKAVPSSNLPVIAKTTIPILLFLGPFILCSLILMSAIMLYPELMRSSDIGARVLRELDVPEHKGFKIQNIAIKKIHQGKKYSMILKYQIINDTDLEQKMPYVRIKIFDKAGSVVYNSVTTNAKFVFEPHEIVTTQTEFHNLNHNTQKFDITLGNKFQLYTR